MILLLGNPDGISELATGLGTALVSNHYSRQYETEADKFAFNNMLKIGIDPQAFVDILSRMEDYSTTATDTDDADDAGDKPEGKDTSGAVEEADEEKLSDFLSSHPNTQLRIKMAQRYSQCFKQGLDVCE